MTHRMPKVLIATPLYPPDAGGPATYAKKLTDFLPGAGIDTDLAYFGDVRHLPKVIRHTAYFVRMLRKGYSNDIIFAQDPVSVGFPAALAALVLRKKFLLKIVGDYAWEQSTQRYGVSDALDVFVHMTYGLPTASLRMIQRFSARRAHRIIVPSEYLKNIVAAWGIEASKIKVIYNDVSVPDTVLSHLDARKSLSIKDERPVFVTAGRMVPWKGFDMLISCMRTIASKHPDVMLFMIGDGPQYAYLRDKIYALDLEENIYLLGKISHDEVMKYLSASDIFLLNTAYEGFSHQLLEAFAAGTPVITTLAGGNQEIVQDGINALVAPYNDQVAWEGAIEHLYADGALRARLGTEAKKSVQRFSAGSMMDATVTLLRSL